MLNPLQFNTVPKMCCMLQGYFLQLDTCTIYICINICIHIYIYIIVSFAGVAVGTCGEVNRKQPQSSRHAVSKIRYTIFAYHQEMISYDFHMFLTFGNWSYGAVYQQLSCIRLYPNRVRAVRCAPRCLRKLAANLWHMAGDLPHKVRWVTHSVC